MIQAIETKYNGYKFRSRLEARWAVFFDKMDIEYTYEPESFMSDYKFELKGQKACYLPDFYLPKLNMWVEVKGDKNKLFDDSARMACILSDLLKKHQGIILLGNVPDGNNIAHNVIYFEKGCLKSSKFFFENNYIKRIENEEVISKKYLTDINNERTTLAKEYLTRIKSKSIIMPKVNYGRNHIWHLFVVRVKNRGNFMEYMKDNNIYCQIHYPIPPHLSEAYEYLGFKRGSFPISEQYSDEVVSLPLYNCMTDEEINYVIDVINSFEV